MSLVIVAGLAVAEDVAGAFKMEGPQGWNVREHPRTRRELNLWRAVGGLEVVSRNAVLGGGSRGSGDIGVLERGCTSSTDNAKSDLLMKHGLAPLSIRTIVCEL